MSRIGGSNLIVMAIVLGVARLFLRWDLVDWLIDAIGAVVISAAVIAGVVGVVKTVSGRRGHHART
jgi:hypothetical protein